MDGTYDVMPRQGTERGAADIQIGLLATYP